MNGEIPLEPIVISEVSYKEKDGEEPGWRSVWKQEEIKLANGESLRRKIRIARIYLPDESDLLTMPLDSRKLPIKFDPTISKKDRPFLSAQIGTAVLKRIYGSSPHINGENNSNELQI